jgi:hypothetical protein
VPPSSGALLQAKANANTIVKAKPTRIIKLFCMIIAPSSFRMGVLIHKPANHAVRPIKALD